VYGSNGVNYNNKRKQRQGAFWEDRYYATAVDTDKYLAKCMVYIDLNMVRAGVVAHPSDYKCSGYHEIQNPPKRYRIIDRRRLLDYFSIQGEEAFLEEHRSWIDEELRNNSLMRDHSWSESIAIGSRAFTSSIKQQLSSRAGNRSVILENGATILKEPEISYNTVFDCKKGLLSHKNTYLWR